MPRGSGRMGKDAMRKKAQVLSEDRSTTEMGGCSAVSARARCSQMIWELTAVIGVLVPGTAVLLSFLIDESLQLHLTSALVLGVIPAGAALLFGATLICLLSFLGLIYDFLRAV